MPSPTTSASHAAMPEDTWFDVLKATPDDVGRLAACLAAGGQPRVALRRRHDDAAEWDVGGPSTRQGADDMVRGCLEYGRVAMATVLFDHGAGRRARGLDETTVSCMHRATKHGPTGYSIKADDDGVVGDDPKTDRILADMGVAPIFLCRAAKHGPTGYSTKVARDSAAGDDPELVRILVGMGADPVIGCRAAANEEMPRCVAAWLDAMPAAAMRTSAPLVKMISSSVDMTPSIERCLAAGICATMSEGSLISTRGHPAHLRIMAASAPVRLLPDVVASVAMMTDEDLAVEIIDAVSERGHGFRSVTTLVSMRARRQRTALAMLDAMPDPGAVDDWTSRTVGMFAGRRVPDQLDFAAAAMDPSLDPRLRIAAWAWGCTLGVDVGAAPDPGPHAAWAIELASRHARDAWGMRLLAACSARVDGP